MKKIIRISGYILMAIGTICLLAAVLITVGAAIWNINLLIYGDHTLSIILFVAAGGFDALGAMLRRISGKIEE